MITPLKGLVTIILKSPSPLSQLRIPTGRRQTSLLFTKRGEFAPGITEDSSLSRRFEPGSSVFKFPALTTEPRCLLSMIMIENVDGGGNDGIVSNFYPELVVFCFILFAFLINIIIINSLQLPLSISFHSRYPPSPNQHFCCTPYIPNPNPHSKLLIRLPIILQAVLAWPRVRGCTFLFVV